MITGLSIYVSPLAKLSVSNMKYRQRAAGGFK
jgi:hypothetical protein